MKRIIALLSVIALGLFFSVQAKTYTSAFSQDFDDADTYTANFSDGTVASDILGTVDSDSCDCAFRIIGDEKIRGYVKRFMAQSKGEYLFAINNYDKYKYAFKQYLPNQKPHDPRLHFITSAKQSGMDEYAIKRIVGHRISDITESVYTKRSVKWLHSELQKIVML